MPVSSTIKVTHGEMVQCHAKRELKKRACPAPLCQLPTFNKVHHILFRNADAIDTDALSKIHQVGP